MVDDLRLLLRDQGSLVETGFHFKTINHLFLLTFLCFLVEAQYFQENEWCKIPDLLFQLKPVIFLGTLLCRACQLPHQIHMMSLSCLDELFPDMSLDFRDLALIIVVDLRAAYV